MKSSGKSSTQNSTVHNARKTFRKLKQQIVSINSKSVSITGSIRSFYKSLKRNRKLRRITLAGVVAIILILALFIYRDIQNNNIYKVGDKGGNSKSSIVSYNGKEYYYNNSITTILLIGIDSTGEMKVSKDYGGQARADNIDLIIFDRRNKSVKLLPISRDTMTEITTYSSKGYETGKLETHLGYAFSFGNGGSASSLNVCDAVSNLLYGSRVYKYVTTNIDSIAYANQLIGGVTVTVPNNDLAGRYPEMVEGAEVELNDANIADFLRYRTGEIASNNGRMQRQQAFLEAYIKKLETMSKDDYLSMWNKLSKDKNKIRTNLNKKLFMSLISDVKKYKYNPSTDNLKIEGTDKVVDGYDAFYPDKGKLKKLVIETFYTE